MAKSKQERKPPSQSGQRSFLRDSKWFNALLLIPVAIIAYLVMTDDKDAGGDVAALADTTISEPLTHEDMDVVARTVDALWRGAELPSDLPDRFDDPAQAVYVAVRSKARRKVSLWKTEGTVLDAIRAGVEEARKKTGDKADQIDVIELSLSHSYRDLDPVKQKKQLTANIHRGIRGLELGHAGKVSRFAPTYIVASNRANKRLMELYQRKHSLTEERMEQEVSYRTFEAEQVLVKLGDTPTAHLLLRGNEVVPVEDVTKENVQRMADLMIDWLVNNTREDGRMTYLYYPSAMEEPSGKNNMIRQWMATNALNKSAADKDDQALWDTVERNLDYNVEHFYDQKDELGFISYDNKIKLGAMSLAAMAMFEHPKREKWARQEAGLRKTILSLWNEDGSFNTFYRPSHRTDNQNYYPGETLLFWATVYAEEKDEELKEKFFKSFEYYRAWHLEPKNRNPAFIPWHTQAYYLMWEQTKDEGLEDFIFEMNDWLIEQMLQWEGDVVYPDALGRFHNPKKRFGVPHASSTGVYLEGLIDAYRLAKAVGDEERTERYRVSMIRGLRSVMQLQFVDDVDMYYVGEEARKYVRGGVRTQVYNNVIRCDNVQHNLMGIIKILRELSAEEFRHP